jgi:cytochrome c oxidase cbb3-type subunit III
LASRRSRSSDAECRSRPELRVVRDAYRRGAVRSHNGGSRITVIALLSVIAWEVFATRAAVAEALTSLAARPTTASQRNLYPRAADPSAVAGGKQLFGANCAFCHGSNAQGGEIGPNLLSSPVVLNDRNGEAIATVVQNGRVNRGMPKFDLNRTQIAEIAAFLHSLGRASPPAESKGGIPVGNAAEGRTYFYGHCSGCHSVSGDLAGIGGKVPWMELQNLIITGGSTGMLGVRLPGARPRTVRVTLPSGAVIEGQLDSIDDFDVTLTDAAGRRRTITRHGSIPKVQIHDPYAAHYELLKANREQAIHDLTAYLEAVK